MTHVKDIAKEIWAWLDKHDLTYDAKLYSQLEWKKRKEKYGNDALFTITTEGSLWELLNYNFSDRLVDSLIKFCAKRGVYFELGYSWTVHFYPI